MELDKSPQSIQNVYASASPLVLKNDFLKTLQIRIPALLTFLLADEPVLAIFPADQGIARSFILILQQGQGMFHHQLSDKDEILYEEGKPLIVPFSKCVEIEEFISELMGF